MTNYAYILKSPGEPDEVFTSQEALSIYCTYRWTVFSITGSELTILRLLHDDTVVASIEKVRLDPETFIAY